METKQDLPSAQGSSRPATSAARPQPVQGPPSRTRVAQPGSTPAPGESQVFEDIHARADKVTPVIEELLRPHPAQWGIND